MWYANMGKARAFVLAASVLTMAACDQRETSPLVTHTPAQALLDPSDNGRQRDDVARGRAWVVNSHGVFVYYTSSGKLVHIPLPGWLWVDTPYACPPDLALGPDGEAVVTSNVVPVLWRIAPRTLAVSRHELTLDTDTDKDVGFSRLVYSAEQRAFLAASETDASTWRIDPSLDKASKIGSYERAREGCGVKAVRAAE